MLSKWGYCTLMLAMPAVAQAQSSLPNNPEALLEALEVSETQGLEIGADGCAVQVAVDAGAPRIRRDNSRWSGECTNGLVNGMGYFTIDGKNTDLTTYYMGLPAPRKEYKDGYEQYKALDGTLVRFKGPEQISTATRNGYADYILYEKVNGSYRLARRLTSLSASCYTLPNHDKNFIDQASPAAVENYTIMLKECKKVREAQWDHRTVEVIAESWFSPELGRDVEKYYICRFNKWTGAVKDKDQVYCNSKWEELKAAFKPKFDEGLNKHRQWIEGLAQVATDRKATLGDKYTAAAAQIAARNLQKKQEEAALALSQAQARQQAFLAGPKGAAFRAKAGGPFAKPASTEQATVLFLGFEQDDGTGYEFSIDDGMFGLPAGVEPGGVWYQTEEAGKPLLAAKFAELSKSGIQTVYVLYMDRMDLWEGPVAFAPRTENVLLSSTTSDNPEYARVQRDLRQAKMDLDRAQAEYDAVAGRANGGGYGTSTAGVLTGVTESISAGSKLENARTRYDTLNRQFSGMSAQTTSESRANVTLGDVTYRSELRRPLVIFACDLVAAMCSEKERVVNHSVSVQVPMAIVPGEKSLETRKSQVKAARAQLEEYSKKLQFGFSLDQLGDFMNGTVRAVPQSLLIDYLQYADKQVTKDFEAGLADILAKNAAVSGAISQAAATLPGRYDDVFGMVRNAAQTKEEVERKQGLQGLE